MPHPLDDAYEKVSGAAKHFDALRAKVNEFDQANPNPFRPVIDPQTGEHVIDVGDPPVLSPEWSRMVGDIAHNLRSALDYLVYELSAEGGGDPGRERTAFPISEDKGEYWKPKGRRKISYRDHCLAGVADSNKTKIDDIQPYHRKDPTRTHLSRLNHLSNRDKHRTAHPAYSMFETPGHIVSTEHGETLSHVEIRYRPGTHDFSVQAKIEREPRPGRSIGMRADRKPQMDRRIGVTIAFGDRRITLDDLRAMIRHVKGILDWFKPAFGAASITN